MYEPDIFQTTRRFGTILENVDLDPATRELDLDSDRFTENTRGAYPLHFIGNADPTGMAGQPTNVVLLTADAFGVLPPISRLTADQAQYHFISGYTAKLAGTEIGVKEPQATFSACFGAPFMPRHPGEYAAMLAERLERLRRPGLAREHRLDRRSVRDRRADEHQPHPLDGPGRPVGRARRRPDRRPIRSSASRSRRRARTSRPRSSSRARRGPTARPTTARPRRWPGCSSRTSRPTPTAVSDVGPRGRSARRRRRRAASSRWPGPGEG